MVNRSLLARTRPEFYAEWAARVREMYRDDPEDREESIKNHIAKSIQEAQALLGGKCPKCGAPSARYVNRQMQRGPSTVPGAWVMYRCSTAPPPGNHRGDACDFMVDYVEGDEAN
jgi:DNA-directed RNA polymerase subunit M/transcription elongation factor TFIIS